MLKDIPITVTMPLDEYIAWCNAARLGAIHAIMAAGSQQIPTDTLTENTNIALAQIGEARYNALHRRLFKLAEAACRDHNIAFTGGERTT